MYIAVVPNRKSPPAILVREGYREEGKSKNRTLANLSKLPPEVIEAVRKVLKGQKLVSVEEAFETVENGSPAHGHVQAIMSAMKQLGFNKLISSRGSRQRDLVVAMVIARILKPQSKLATTRWWSSTTLPDLLGVEDADEDELYDAMDWLVSRQQHIEKKLASRHLPEGGLALYDLTSSYFEGTSCPLAARGHNRDQKKGKLQVNYGLLTNEQGIPVSVSVFEGNTGDPKTVLPQVTTIREKFQIADIVLVGDRGMITQKQVDVIRDIDGVDWISALRPGAITELINAGSIQMSFFDECNLFEVTHPDFPGERLVACRNPELATRRSLKRASLLEATAKELEKVRRMVYAGRLQGKECISKRINGVLGQYRVGQYYAIEVRDDGFDYTIDRSALASDIAAQNKGHKERIERKLKRYEGHVESIAKKLEKIRVRTTRGRLHGADTIGVRVGKVLNKYKMGKHIDLEIGDNSFEFEINQTKVEAETALDGIYVIRTSVKKGTMAAEQAVRSYKLLSNVERAFRCLKSIDLMVRPIRHRLQDRVRAHIFLCMLAYYVQWHMMEAWRPLLFADEEKESKTHRDPVAPAKRSEAAQKKACTRKLEDGTETHSFRTLLAHLGEIVRNICRTPGSGEDAPTFLVTTTPNPKQQRALNLLTSVKV